MSIASTSVTPVSTSSPSPSSTSPPPVSRALPSFEVTARRFPQTRTASQDLSQATFDVSPTTSPATSPTNESPNPSFSVEALRNEESIRELSATSKPERSTKPPEDLPGTNELPTKVPTLARSISRPFVPFQRKTVDLNVHSSDAMDKPVSKLSIHVPDIQSSVNVGTTPSACENQHSVALGMIMLCADASSAAGLPATGTTSKRQKKDGSTERKDGHFGPVESLPELQMMWKVEAKKTSRQAMTHLQEGEYEKADTAFQNALHLYQKLNDKVKGGCVLHQLGVTSRQQGLYDRAISLIKDAAKIFLDVERFDCFANAVFDMNLCFTRRELYQDSQDLLESAQPHVPRFPPLDQAKFTYNFSLAQLKLGSYLDASRGFAWSCSQLRSLVQTRGWTQACPTEVVALLGNAYLNHAESLRLLIWTSHTDPAQSQNYSLEGFTNAAKHVRQKVEQTGAHSEQTGAHSVQSSSASPRASLEQLESVYLQALACHLRASHRALASAELVAFTVHQLVGLFHATAQYDKSVNLLLQCKQLALAQTPRYRAHVMKWTRDLVSLQHHAQLV
eukprot:g5937.t1